MIIIAMSCLCFCTTPTPYSVRTTVRNPYHTGTRTGTHIYQAADIILVDRSILYTLYTKPGTRHSFYRSFTDTTLPIPGPNVPCLQRTTVPYPASPAAAPRDSHRPHHARSAPQASRSCAPRARTAADCFAAWIILYGFRQRCRTPLPSRGAACGSQYQVYTVRVYYVRIVHAYIS